jgi:intracellular protein transport protein USO1
MILTPYMPVPETNGEEWDRLEAATGIDALLELIMHGEYNGQDAAQRQKASVDLRATAVGVFEVCVPSLVSWTRVLLKPL